MVDLRVEDHVRFLDKIENVVVGVEVVEHLTGIAGHFSELLFLVLLPHLPFLGD